MHTRLEEVQFSELSAPIQPDHCQPGQMLFPSSQGWGLGEGWLALIQLTRVRAPGSLPWVSRAILGRQSKSHYSLGAPAHIPDPYL